MEYHNCGHIVIDIETLGTTEDAVVLQVGAVYVNPNGKLDDVFNLWIDPRIELSAGFKVDSQTMRWWLDRPKQFCSYFERAEFSPTPYSDFLNWIEPYITSKQPMCYWGNSPRFDLQFLDHHIRHFTGRKLEIPYWSECDYRTVKPLFVHQYDLADMKEEWEPKMDYPLVAHDALSDALLEAYNLAKFIWRP